MMQKKLLFLVVLSFLTGAVFAQNADLKKVFNLSDTTTVSETGRSVTAENGKIYEFLKDSIRVFVWDTADTATPLSEGTIFPPIYYDFVHGDFEVVGGSKIFSGSVFNKVNASVGEISILRIYLNENFSGYQQYLSNPNFPLFGAQPFYDLIGRVSEDKFYVYDPVNLRAIAFERLPNTTFSPVYDVDLSTVTTDSSHIAGIGGRRDADLLYVWNKDENEIVRLDTSGTIDMRYDFDTQSDLPGRDMEIVGFHVEDNGRIVVTVLDSPNIAAKVSQHVKEQRLVFLGGGFQFLGSVELESGGSRGSFNAIEQVGADYDGNIYLGESGNRNITMLSNFEHQPHNTGTFKVTSKRIDLYETQVVDYDDLILTDWNIEDTLAAIRLFPAQHSNFPTRVYFDANANGQYEPNEILATNTQDSVYLTAQNIINGQLVVRASASTHTGLKTNMFSYKWSDNGTNFNSIAKGYYDVEVFTDRVVVAGTAGKDGWRLLAPTREGDTFQQYLDVIWTQGAIGSDLPTAAPNVFRYSVLDEEWIPVTDLTETLHLGESFAVYMFEDDDYFTPGIQGGWPKVLTPDLSKPGHSAFDNFTLSVTNASNISSPSHQGLNLIGNPFSSQMKGFDPGFIRDSVDAVLALWDASLNNGEGGYVYETITNQVLSAPKIAAGQGFWVQAQGMNASLTLNLFSVLQGTGQVPKIAPAQKLTVLLEDEGYSDKLTLNDSGTSFKKIPSLSEEYHEVYTYGEFGTPMAVESADFSDELVVEVGIRSTRFSQATLQLQSTVEIDQAYLKQTLNNGQIILHYPENDAFTIDLIKDDGEWVHEGTLQLVTRLKQLTNIERDHSLPTRFELSSYPNPFNPSTTITYSLPETAVVSVDVFNIMGQKVADILQDQQKTAGVHTLSLDMSKQASGVYLVRISTPKQSISRKITLIK